MGLGDLIYDKIYPNDGKLVHSTTNDRLVYQSWVTPVYHFFGGAGWYRDPTNYRSKPEAEWPGKSTVWPLAVTHMESRGWGMNPGPNVGSSSYWYIYDSPTLVHVSCELVRAAIRLQTHQFRGQTIDSAFAPSILASATTPPSGTMRLSAYPSDTSTPTDTTSPYYVTLSTNGSYTIPCGFSALNYMYIILEIVDWEPPDEARRNNPPSSAATAISFSVYYPVRLRIP